jgi:hypothetical protein
MRCATIFAAALVAVPLAAVTQPSAHAQEYCGFAGHPGSIVQCGYSSLEGCQNSIGKGAMCFVNPYVALNARGATPSSVARVRFARS